MQAATYRHFTRKSGSTPGLLIAEKTEDALREYQWPEPEKWLTVSL
jgi:hypothetical protein